MRSLFTRAPVPLLGVDVSASSIKVVELSRTREGAWVLEHCAIEPLERGWIIDGVVDRFDEVADALRRAVQRSGSKARNAALALPPSAVITRRILLPAGLSGHEMELQIEAEASQYIPFPLEEVNLDFCPIGRQGQTEGEQEVLIIASRRDRVQDCVGLAEAASLKASLVDVETHAARLATLRLIQHLGWRDDELVALVEIGAFNTVVQVLRHGDVVYERDHAFGGDALTQLLTRQYDMTPEEAERRKRLNALPEDARLTVLPEFTRNLAQEVAHVLQMFRASTPFTRVDHILLAGGSATVVGLDAAVEKQTGAPCLRADPFDGMAMGAGVKAAQVRQQASAYLTACGLALRRFD